MQVDLHSLDLPVLDLVALGPPDGLFQVLVVVVVENLAEASVFLLNDDVQHGQVLVSLVQVNTQSYK